MQVHDSEQTVKTEIDMCEAFLYFPSNVTHTRYQLAYQPTVSQINLFFLFIIKLVCSTNAIISVQMSLIDSYEETLTSIANAFYYVSHFLVLVF